MTEMYRSYPNYRDTVGDWLGRIPSEWEVIRLGHLFKRVKRTGHANKELLSVYRDHGVVPKNSRDDNNNKASEDLSAYQLVEPKDLVLNKMKAWQGSVAVSSHEGIVSPAYFVYKPAGDNGESYIARYVHYLLRCPQYISQYLRYSKGIRVNQWDLDPDMFKSLEVLLPSTGEQQTIAAFLDYETARIDQLIAKQQRLIELLKEKRQAVISHAVTKGLNPGATMKDSGVEWLGEVPEHWKVARVKQISDFITSGPRGWSDFITDDADDIFLQSGDLNNNLGLELDTAKRVAPPAGAEGTRTKLHNGDIVVCITGANTGRVAFAAGLERTTYINQHLSLIRAKRDQINPSYLSLYLSAKPGRSYFNVVQYGLKEGLSLSNVREAPLSLPPLEEQDKIVKSIDLLKSKLTMLSEHAERQIELLKERRTALISAAVTGKIDLRGWAAPVSTKQGQDAA